MQFKKLTALICTVTLLFATASPAFANTATDEIGAATTIYQDYLIDGATGELRIDTDVAGTASKAETYIGEALDLSTRLVPFSLDVSMTYYANIDPTTFFLTFRNRNYNDQNAAVQRKVGEIIADTAIYENNYQKLRYINSYLIDHCDYVTEAAEDPDGYETAFTAYGCLIEGEAVCEGYANSVQLLCEVLQIPCIKVTGSAYGGNHIWNAVYLDNKWWMLDVTFNDPLLEGTDRDRWTYFLLNMDTFKEKGSHEYDQKAFETSKEIYTGRTVGQRLVTVPFDKVSLRNAGKNDVIDPALKAYQNQQDGVTDGEFKTESSPLTNQPIVITQSTEEKAQALKERGLFMGDEGGFRLADTMTRVEMGIMVMRMNDGTKTLDANGDYFIKACPFTDVPSWAKGSIGFLYDKKLTAGLSATTYGTGAVTKQDYAVMMMRVLGIEHSYQDALAIAVTHGILTEEQAGSSPIALRADIVDMTYATLQLLEEQQSQETESDTNADAAVSDDTAAPKTDAATNTDSNANTTDTADNKTTETSTATKSDTSADTDTATETEITDKSDKNGQ